MNELSVKVRGMPQGYVDIRADGKPLAFSKNEFGSSQTVYGAEKDEVEITLCKYHPLSAPHWLIMSLLFFIIGIFGIFDCRADGLCIVFDIKLKVKLNGANKLTLAFNSPVKRGDGTGYGGEAVSVEADCEYSAENNEYFVDTVAKKRNKILRIISLGFWLGAAAIAALCVYIYVFNK